MSCQMHDTKPLLAGPKLRERWLRLLFDMYGIRPAASTPLDSALLPASPLVRSVPLSRHRTSRLRRAAIVLPFRSGVSLSPALRTRKERHSGVEQPEDEVSPEAPMTDVNTSNPEPEDVPSSGASGATETAADTDGTSIRPAADGDDRPAAADEGELH